jgi:hypothetical protein
MNSEIEYFKSKECDICSGQNDRYWMFNCPECHHDVHLSCAGYSYLQRHDYDTILCPDCYQHSDEEADTEDDATEATEPEVSDLDEEEEQIQVEGIDSDEEDNPSVDSQDEEEELREPTPPPKILKDKKCRRQACQKKEVTAEEIQAFLATRNIKIAKRVAQHLTNNKNILDMMAHDQTKQQELVENDDFEFLNELLDMKRLHHSAEMGPTDDKWDRVPVGMFRRSRKLSTPLLKLSKAVKSNLGYVPQSIHDTLLPHSPSADCNCSEFKPNAATVPVVAESKDRKRTHSERDEVLPLLFPSFDDSSQHNHHHYNMPPVFEREQKRSRRRRINSLFDSVHLNDILRDIK